MNYKSIIESLLFSWAEPVNIDDLSKMLKLNKKDTELILKELEEEYKRRDRGIRLVKTNNSFQLSSKPENYEYIKDFFKNKNEKSLSKPALETLSIIAYKQPVTKLEIEELRGVNCDGTIRSLTEIGLIEVSGTLDRIGHPKLYSTTDDFLKKFGIENLDELPNLENIGKEDI